MCRTTECLFCHRRTQHLCKRQLSYGHTSDFHLYDYDLPPAPPYFVHSMEGLCVEDVRYVPYCPPRNYPTFQIAFPPKSQALVAFDYYCDSIVRSDGGYELDFHPRGISRLSDARTRALLLRRIGRPPHFNIRVRPQVRGRWIIENYGRGEATWASQDSIRDRVETILQELRALRQRVLRISRPSIDDHVPHRVEDDGHTFVEDSLSLEEAVAHGDTGNHESVDDETLNWFCREYTLGNPTPGWDLTHVVDGSETRPHNVYGRARLIRLNDGRPSVWIHELQPGSTVI